MTELETLGRRINALIAKRDAGSNVQTEIDALMIQLDAHPEAVAARDLAAKEAAYDLF